MWSDMSGTEAGIGTVDERGYFGLKRENVDENRMTKKKELRQLTGAFETGWDGWDGWDILV